MALKYWHQSFRQIENHTLVADRIYQLLATVTDLCLTEDPVPERGETALDGELPPAPTFVLLAAGPG